MSRGGALVLGLVLGVAWAEPAAAWAAPVRASEPGGEGVDDARESEGVDDARESEGVDDARESEGVDDAREGEGVAAPVDPTEPSASSRPAPVPATHDVPADDFEAEPSLAPGGYYGHGVILERPPPDGRNRIVVGSILVPLGTLATISSAVGTYMTVPAHCAERLGAAGIEATASRCKGLFTFNVIRTTYGALMLASGATILALGIIQRERYRKWRHAHGMRARLAPTLDAGRRGAAVGLRLQF